MYVIYFEWNENSGFDLWNYVMNLCFMSCTWYMLKVENQESKKTFKRNCVQKTIEMIQNRA